MTITKASTIYRKNYSQPTYHIESVDLLVQIDSAKTTVTARSYLKKNVLAERSSSILRLAGEQLHLKEIEIDGIPLSSKRYQVDETGLDLMDPPEQFTLTTKVEIHPETNKTLSGLYMSGGNYYTQCEAEGFRRITFFLDRPDVLASYTTRIEGPKKQCPVLLSNGDLVEKGEVNDQIHYAVWRDPHPKPSYLFALVAANLSCRSGEYTTAEGRRVQLQFYVEPQNIELCDHAMSSLKKAMRWDELSYGLSYDLDTYMIVAVDDFNMGAMENKGLNIFNSKYVLASPASATDQDFLGVEKVIAHEYFHNWTGNRVTCRDWFQLSLKEGLTVFRDQEFSADMNSRAVQRINDAKIMQQEQFREDQSPMAHPVRPDSYVEINNFYTLTVYHKGAEVVRMLSQIIGWENFRKGMDMYFARHDGQAVTCDDFVQAMEDASGYDLGQFRLWYSQSGTPQVHVEMDWEGKSGTLCLDIAQKTAATPDQKDKEPLHIPIKIGLLFPSDKVKVGEEHLLHLREERQSFYLSKLKEKPVVSVLRDFSAPVQLTNTQSREELCFLMEHDDNLYNRWYAADRFFTLILLDAIKALRKGKDIVVPSMFINAVKKVLEDTDDRALCAYALTPPSERALAQESDPIDPVHIHKACMRVREQVAKELMSEFIAVYESCEKENRTEDISPEQVGLRSLKNLCLQYMMTPALVTPASLKRCFSQFERQANMTDTIAALAQLTHVDCPERKRAFELFYQKWQQDSLVLDKWFSLQAVSSLPSVLDEVKGLLDHPRFSLEKPNKVRALIGAFSVSNHYRFHDQKGMGYRFLAEQIYSIDRFNPQIAARLVTPLIHHSKYKQELAAMMVSELEGIKEREALSKDVREIVEKALSA